MAVETPALGPLFSAVCGDEAIAAVLAAAADVVKAHADELAKRYSPLRFTVELS